jgi:hypothetical protein
METYTKVKRGARGDMKSGLDEDHPGLIEGRRKDT